MTEKEFPLGNFLIKLNCKFINKEFSNYANPILIAVYTLSFWTQDRTTCLAQIPMSSEIFFDIIDIFRWYGVDDEEGFLYDFPPAKIFEQYTLAIGYEKLDEYDNYDYDSGISIILFKQVRNYQDTIIDTKVTYKEFINFVKFLIDYSYCAEGKEYDSYYS